MICSFSSSVVGHVARVGVGQAAFVTDARPRSSRYPLILRRVAEGGNPGPPWRGGWLRASARLWLCNGARNLLVVSALALGALEDAFFATPLPRPPREATRRRPAGLPPPHRRERRTIERRPPAHEE